MSGSDGKVLARRVAEDGRTPEVCFLVVGRANARVCPAMRQYAEDALADGATRVQIDLADCSHCDSTFLGTMLRFRHVFRGDGQVRLVRPSAAVRQILAQLGAERLFNIVEHTSATCSEVTWQELPDDEGRTASSRFKLYAVEAHQELARAGGELTKRFGAVAEAMRQEWFANPPQDGR